VFGLVAVTRAVLPTTRAQRSGRIIDVSSIGGYRGGAGFGVYCSTKFAVEGLSEPLRAELAPLGIHVAVVEPGYFRTDFLDSTSLSVSGDEIVDYVETAGAVRRAAKELNRSQPGDPDRLAQVLVDFATRPTRRSGYRSAAMQWRRSRRSIHPMPKSSPSGGILPSRPISRTHGRPERRILELHVAPPPVVERRDRASTSAAGIRMASFRPSCGSLRQMRKGSGSRRTAPPPSPAGRGWQAAASRARCAT
jgi:hypothetical protein